MKKILLLNILLLLILNADLQAQVLHKNILSLRGHMRPHQDTSSQYYLKQYGHLPNLLVQVSKDYEHEDLEIFKLAPNIPRLSIYSDSLKSLSGLEHLQQLEDLSIGNSQIQDFTPLKSLSQLKKLRLNTNVKIDFPLDYPLLKELEYSCNYNLKDCKFPILEQLTIHQAVAFDYHFDDEKYGLKYQLETPCCEFDLSRFEKLNTVWIYDLHIQNIKEIIFPKDVKKISISNCSQLKEVNQLTELDELEYLRISRCNNIQSFEFLRNLKNVEWKIQYMGRAYKNEDLEMLLNHRKGLYYYVDDPSEHGDPKFYNFHTSVIEKARLIFAKHHELILSSKPSREEFLDMIVPMIKELNELCTNTTCAIEWSDEESHYLMDFLLDMAQLVGHEFDESHFYTRYEWAME